MVGEVMREVHNFFEDIEPLEGEFAVSCGVLTPNEGIKPEQYVAIVGSNFCDGVWLFDGSNLVGCTADDEFEGRVYTLHPPSSFLRLCESIKEYTANAPVSAVASETFGAYSRTMVTDSNGVVTWQKAFSKQLDSYRRMFTEVFA